MNKLKTEFKSAAKIHLNYRQFIAKIHHSTSFSLLRSLTLFFSISMRCRNHLCWVNKVLVFDQQKKSFLNSSKEDFSLCTKMYALIHPIHFLLGGWFVSIIKEHCRILRGERKKTIKNYRAIFVPLLISFLKFF